MKLKVIIVFMLLTTPGICQQWSGSTSTTGNIHRSGNVGINTTNPQAPLDVNGRVSSRSLSLTGFNSIPSVNGFRNRLELIGGPHGALVFHPGKSDELMFGFHSNGNFYWGTGRSATKPDYYSMILNGSNGNLTVRGTAITKSASIIGRNNIASVNGFQNRLELVGGPHGALVFHPGKPDELMFGFHSNGNFYWGTGRSATKPDYYSMLLNGSNGNLGIRGKLTANEVNVKVGGWADFVFEEGYELPTLEEIETHIKANGHLEGIPNANKVEKDGLDLGMMNAKLLQKIEELTLHMIAMNKRMQALENENAALKKHIQD